MWCWRTRMANMFYSLQILIIVLKKSCGLHVLFIKNDTVVPWFFLYLLHLSLCLLPKRFLLLLLPNPHEETMFEWDIYNWWIFTLPILFWMYLLYDLYHYHIKFERGGGLNCASSLLIAYYKFIPHACLSLGKSLSFVLCFRTMHDLLFCLNFY